MFCHCKVAKLHFFYKKTAQSLANSAYNIYLCIGLNNLCAVFCASQHQQGTSIPIPSPLRCCGLKRSYKSQSKPTGFGQSHRLVFLAVWIKGGFTPPFLLSHPISFFSSFLSSFLFCFSFHINRSSLPSAP